MAAHRYWRANFNTNGGGGYVDLNECIMRTTPGGAQAATGGTASASSIFGGGYVAANAFDGNAGTFWASASGAPQWLQYDLGLGNALDFVELAIKSSPSNPLNEAPLTGNLEFSDNGSSWTQAFSWTIGPWTTNNQTLTASIVVVPTVGIQSSEGRTFGVYADPQGPMNVSEGRVFSIYNYPSIAMQASEDYEKVVVQTNGPLDVSEARIFAIARGRLESHRVRAFPFRLDGHDMVALRLGEVETLLYDFTTQQWSQWASENEDMVWRPSTGNNWTGMGKRFFDDGLTSDIILGDDTFGLLWGLNAEEGVDEHPDPLRPELPYIRRIVGGVPMRLRSTQKVGAAYLTADMGNPQLAGATMGLRTSDDYGKNWTDHGTVTVDAGNYDQEFSWRSLGLIRAPGRIFELTDNGATARIDSLDIR